METAPLASALLALATYLAYSSPSAAFIPSPLALAATRNSKIHTPIAITIPNQAKAEAKAEATTQD
jgi:hypothetical protein